MYPNNSKTQLNYIFTNKKWINSAVNCEACTSFEGVSFDCRIVSVKILLSLHRNKPQIIKASQYDWSSHTKSDIRNHFTIVVRNKFDTLQETIERHTANDEYENFITTHIEATAECIPIKPRTRCRVPWESIAFRKK